MRLLLVAVNAKYIHTNLAVRYLTQRAVGEGFPCEFAEYTINQPFDTILSGIYSRQPEIVDFSCYLWNIELVKQLCVELSKLLPGVHLWLGGPEVSYHSAHFLDGVRQCELIMRGEGEETFPSLLDAMQKEKDFSGVLGITWRDFNGNIRENPPAKPFDLSKLPFAYQDLEQLQNKIVYYESSRGCPYSCTYCLSSVERGVRFVPVQRVCRDLQRFLDAGVQQVKFVDRTFNCNRDHADTILQYLLEHDNGKTNFHFEISADILEDSTIKLVNRAREGLFQFEVGVQSTNPKTIRAIQRACDNQKLFEKVHRLKAAHNAHVHLDLIAGLPLEDYSSFGRSYDEVFSNHPDMLQLGFLKVLKGSAMEAQSKQYGIVYQDRAPYEVLFTDFISYQELRKLKQIDVLNDSYLNSGRFQVSLGMVLQQYDSPFHFFEDLSVYYEQQGLFEKNLGKYDAYLHLYRFYEQHFGSCEKLKWCMKHDIFARENAKSLPDILNLSLYPQYKERFDAFYEREENLHRYLSEYLGEHPKRIQKITHLEAYPYDIFTGDDRPVVLLYSYDCKDVSGNAHITDVSDDVLVLW